ncbi:ras-related protein Rab-7L1-like [Periophthalmus magnuspinnatus]|uniref:ras-related protein Rab-7L1-like n=1 Tax=Periophthalmus magnuspinnatus TaxID=409849 RepID=UPI002437197F|nr:ras-related protein Rab-7L1-like [Periophthalmus magnuspinnatus]
MAMVIIAMESQTVWSMREHLMKILIIGDGNVGKSSFVNRYVNGRFSQSYKMTMGVDFSLKVLQWSERDKVRLQLWDIAGQERFISMTRIYYRGAVGCVVIFDVADSTSFLSCRLWKQDLDLKTMLPNGQPLPCILLANKCDLSQRAVSADNIDKFSRANGFVTWMETSVKNNRNVEEAMGRLVQEILLIQPSPDPVLPPPEDLVHSEPNQTRAHCC